MPPIVKVQIPYYIYVELKKHVEPADAFHVLAFMEWAANLYTETNAPVVQWYLGSQKLDDIFGYLYTMYLSLEGLSKVSAK